VKHPRLALFSTLAVFAFAAPAAAEDVRVTADGHVIVFDGNPTRLRVKHDRAGGRLIFHPAEANMVLRDAPVVVLKTETGPHEATLVPLSSEPGAWVLTHASLRGEAFDGTVRIMADGKTYTAPLAVATTKTVVKVPAPRYQGRVIAFNDCGMYAELVQDPATGTVMLYSFDDMPIATAPTYAVVSGDRSTDLAFVAVEGKTGVWKVVHPSFRTANVSGKVLISHNGKSCYAFVRGGQIVTVPNGPRFEVVYDRTGQAATFYALDETYDGRPYVVEQPTFVYQTTSGPRTVVLTPVQGEPRAWRAAGIDAGVMRPGDAMLRFSLGGRSLETRLGLSGLGIDLR
jgi:hypothetical protein